MGHRRTDQESTELSAVSLVGAFDPAHDRQPQLGTGGPALTVQNTSNAVSARVCAHIGVRSRRSTCCRSGPGRRDLILQRAGRIPWTRISRATRCRPARSSRTSSSRRTRGEPCSRIGVDTVDLLDQEQVLDCSAGRPRRVHTEPPPRPLRPRHRTSGRLRLAAAFIELASTI